MTDFASMEVVLQLGALEELRACCEFTREASDIWPNVVTNINRVVTDVYKDKTELQSTKYFVTTVKHESGMFQPCVIGKESPAAAVCSSTVHRENLQCEDRSEVRLDIKACLSLKHLGAIVLYLKMLGLVVNKKFLVEESEE